MTRTDGLTLDRIWTTARFPARSQGVSYRGSSWGYPELHARAESLAARLRRHGVSRGDVVSVLDFNTPEHFLLHQAVPGIGAVLHSVNLGLPPAQIAATLETARPRLVLLGPEVPPPLRGLAQGHETLEMDGAMGFPGLPEAPPGPEGTGILGREVDEEDDAVLLFTSGTTGTPKGVRYSHRKVLLAIWGISTLLSAHPGPASLRSSDTLMGLIPFYHLFGWGLVYIGPFLGAQLVLDGRFEPARTLAVIESEHVSWFNAVPTMLHMLLRQPRREVLRGRKALVGGMAIPKKLVAECAEIGLEITSIYGFTDGLIAGIGRLSPEETSLELPDQMERLRMATTLAPLSEVRIRELPGAGFGEVEFRAPWLPHGYVDDPVRTREAYPEGWFRTGDLGARDGVGRLQILDRERDAVKSGGEWIPTSLLENLLSELPFVEMAAVVGRPDEKWGERPVAFVQLRDAPPSPVPAMRAHLERHAAEGRIRTWWIPEEFQILPGLPLTSTGKVDKKSLRASRTEPTTPPPGTPTGGSLRQ